VTSHGGSRFQVALTESGASAAFAAFDQRDREPKRLQHLDRGDADMRLVIAHERIVPENDFATFGRVGALRRPDAAARRPYLMKPAIEPLPGVMRQRPFVG
jgi:hypothetical protein